MVGRSARSCCSCKSLPISSARFCCALRRDKLHQLFPSLLVTKEPSFNSRLYPGVSDFNFIDKQTIEHFVARGVVPLAAIRTFLDARGLVSGIFLPPQIYWWTASLHACGNHCGSASDSRFQPRCQCASHLWRSSQSKHPRHCTGSPEKMQIGRNQRRGTPTSWSFIGNVTSLIPIPALNNLVFGMSTNFDWRGQLR